MPFAFLPLLTAMTLSSAQPSSNSLEQGVSRVLATTRASRISDVRYALALKVPAARQEPVTGTETITFTLADSSAPVVLDFEPD
jgi:hypothetical protein